MKTRLLTVMLICLGLITSNSTYGQIECKLTKEGTGIWHLKLVRDSINIDGVNYQFHLGDYTLGWNGGTNYPENVMPDKVSILSGHFEITGYTKVPTNEILRKIHCSNGGGVGTISINVDNEPTVRLSFGLNDANDTYFSVDHTVHFAERIVEWICLEHWDTDKDRKLSVEEAAAVTDIGTAFSLYYYLEQSDELSREIADLLVSEFRSFNELGLFIGLTSIGECAFVDSKRLNSVIIPPSVTSIGKYAFAGCDIHSIIIPPSVTSIGEGAFGSCSINSVIIPPSVTSIGEGAFSNCYSLTSIVVNSGNTVYDSRENCNAIIKTATNELISGCKNTTIPSSVTSIGKSAFSDCTGLTSVTIPEGVTSIGNRAFARTGLTSVTIPSSVTRIGKSAFSDCTGLTSVTIPEGVTSIGESAFENCKGLTSVTIPSSTTSIGEYAFLRCESLTSVTILSNVYTSISSRAFAVCTSLTSVTLNCAYVFDWFAGMTSIQEVTLGESVTSISNDAFNGTGWYEAQPDGLLYLDNWLLGYKGDKPTGDLAIADGTRGIAQSAFRDCTGLTSVTSFIKEPFTIDNYIFSVYTTATLYVPAGTKGKYEATPGWNKFRSILEIEMPDQPKGDVNGDQTVDVADIASVIDCMAGSEAVDKAAADVNGDGTVDVADIATIISEMAAQARQQDIED